MAYCLEGINEIGWIEGNHQIITAHSQSIQFFIYFSDFWRINMGRNDPILNVQLHCSILCGIGKETSPLHGMDAAALEEAQGAILVMIEGYDESSAQHVRTRKTYLHGDVVFGHRYVDVLEPTDTERVRVNYTKFHLTEPDA